MKSKTYTSLNRPLGLIALVIVTSFLFSPLYAQNEPSDVREAPYFLVNGQSQQVELPLKSTSAEVKIAGVIADVKIRQTYVNSGTAPVEAVYIFPGSTQAAVYGMNMKVGERIIKAEIKEKQEAQETFDNAKTEGKTASLLQQHRPNVFQMNVANIQPGETVEVELLYNELLIPHDGLYEFVFPKVVGPRYTNEEGMRKDQWVLNPYTNPRAHQNTFSRPAFDIKVNLNTPLPLQQVLSPSHQVEIQYQSEKEARIKLASPGNLLDNKDFIIRYGLGGGAIQSGISMYRGKDENFFLAMLQPPTRVVSSEIVPREYIFIVDVSGSMNGFPLSITKNLIKDLLSNLHASDKFNVLLFSASSDALSGTSLPATDANIKKAISFVEKEPGSGGTELLPALKRALALPKEAGLSRNIVIATDGYVTVEKEAFDLVSQNLGDANFFPFGIGGNVNRYIIEGLARAGHGEPFILTKPSEAGDYAEKFRKYIESPILTDIEVGIKGLDVYDVEPHSFPDLFAERPILIFGKWKGKPQGKLIIKGVNSEGKFRQSYSMDENDVSEDCEALAYLWARHRIMRLSDYNSTSNGESFRKEITALGLQYHLLTEFTSFVGVDDQQVEVSVETPISGGDVPEPHEWVLILVSLVMAIFLMIKMYV